MPLTFTEQLCGSASRTSLSFLSTSSAWFSMTLLLNLRNKHSPKVIFQCSIPTRPSTISCIDRYSCGIKKKRDLLRHTKCSVLPFKLKGRLVGTFSRLSSMIVQLKTINSTEGAIHVSYSYIHRNGPEAPEPSVFHTRQISYPLSVTVYQMLECLSMDIIPLPSHFVTNETDEESQWCLFSLEIRNCYGTPFDVTLTRIQKGQAVLLRQ